MNEGGRLMNEPAVWEAWAERWDRFQECYVPARERQFSAIADYLDLCPPGGASRILDLCSGPGSAAGRLLRRRPGAEVVALDYDPWALELGRCTAYSDGRLRWIEADLLDPTWTERLAGDEFDAVVATTALHWFNRDAVARIYRDLATLLPAGGVFLASLITPAGDPAVGELARRARIRREEDAVAAPGGENWATFWTAARAEPVFRDLLAERDRRLAWRHPQPVLPLGFHTRALSQAGFHAAGEVWREHETGVLLAIR